MENYAFALITLNFWHYIYKRRTRIPMPHELPPHILIFDSGVGGLSVAREIRDAVPDCKLSYFFDNAFFPYGTKSDSVLLERIVSQIELLHQAFTPDIVVIACNTASTLVLDALRARFHTPFVGVVPAIKPASASSLSGVIGVLATPATVNRPYTQKLIEDFAQDVKVYLHGSDALVTQAERKLNNQEVVTDVIHAEIETLLRLDKSDSMDTIVLACTHFPLLLEEVDKAANACGRSIHWMDSGKAIARRVVQLLNRGLETHISTNPGSIFVTASDTSMVDKSFLTKCEHYIADGA